MAFYLTAFIVSGTIMVLVVLHRYMEVSYGRGLVMKTLVHKADHWSHHLFEILRHLSSYATRKNFALFVNYVIVVLIRALIVIGSVIRKEMSKLLDKLSRKQEVLTRNGAASAYLRQISEDKERNHINRIP